MTEEYINDLFEKYRANEVAEEDLTPEEYQALIQLYDKRIREQKANNLNRRRAVEAYVDDRSTEPIIKTIKQKLGENGESTKGDYLNKYYLKPNGSGRGLDLYCGMDYLATYCSYMDCLYDLSYHYTLVDFEVLINMFSLNVDVFISHKSDDFAIAKKVFDYLVSKGISVFLSEMSLPALSGADYSAEIDDALEHAKNIVVIASSKENVNSGWVKYEWNTFANEKRSGRKNGNIVTLVTDNMQIFDLPILLRQYEVLQYVECEKIVEFVRY